MAVELEFISIIIPIKNIEKYYPGGFEKYKKDYFDLIGGKIWYDDYILRDGAMNPIDIEYIVNEWEKLGLKPFKEGKKEWDELCVVDYFGGLTLPCKWISKKETTVKHIDDKSKTIINREDFK